MRLTLALTCLFALALSSQPARAAEVTRVESSFDKDHPFGIEFDVGFDRTQRRAKITREHHQDNAVADVLELRYTAITQRLPMRLAIGLYHDLEIHASMAYVFNYDQSWWFPSETNDLGQLKVTAANSTITNNVICPSGALVTDVDPNAGTSSAAAPGSYCNNGTSTAPLFGVPGNSYRGGFTDVSMGISWAPLSDERDESKPKWVLSFDYSAPSASVDQPWVATSTDTRGGIGDGAHRFTFSTALSKRLGAIDPYIKLSYTLSVPSGNSESNCDIPSDTGQRALLLGVQGTNNCGISPWTKDETGLKPPHVGGVLFGAEFYPYDNPVRKQRVSIDIQFGAFYVSEGRGYDELSDALQKLLYSEEYFTLGGSIGIYARPVEYVQLKLNASLYTDTEHFLTNEPIGQDVNHNCRGNASQSCVDLGNPPGNSNEVNPNFNFAYDMPGTRFRISEVSVFTIMATGVVNF